MASKAKTKNQPKKKRNAYVVGLLVFVALIALTIVEFYVALLPSQSPTLLFLIAFLKAALVIYFFMHVYRLWRPDDHADDHADVHGGH